MAKTNVGTNDALTQKLIVAQSKDLFEDAKKNSFFSKFSGPSKDNILYVKDNLKKNKGDQITFGIRDRITGAGVTGDQILEGKEVALSTFSYSVGIELYRQAVRDDGALTRQRASYGVDDESIDALKTWMTEKRDTLCFDQLNQSPTTVFRADATSGFVITEGAGAAATAEAALIADDKLTPVVIEAVNTWSKTGGKRKQSPLRPITVDGNKHYIMVVSPEVGFDLRRNAEYLTNIREARARSPKNPIFGDATAMIGNVLIYESEFVNNGTSGTGVPFAKCFLLGAQALCEASVEPMTLIPKKFDWDNQHGWAINMMSGFGKTKFNSKDYGSVGIWVARTNIA